MYQHVTKRRNPKATVKKGLGSFNWTLHRNIYTRTRTYRDRIWNIMDSAAQTYDLNCMPHSCFGLLMLLLTVVWLDGGSPCYLSLSVVRYCHMNLPTILWRRESHSTMSLGLFLYQFSFSEIFFNHIKNVAHGATSSGQRGTTHGESPQSQHSEQPSFLACPFEKMPHSGKCKCNFSIATNDRVP